MKILFRWRRCLLRLSRATKTILYTKFRIVPINTKERRQCSFSRYFYVLCFSAFVFDLWIAKKKIKPLSNRSLQYNVIWISAECQPQFATSEFHCTLLLITSNFKKKPKKQLKTQALFLSRCNYTELLLQEISKTEQYIPSPDSLPLFILSRLGPCNKYPWVTALFSDHDLLKKECNSLSACGSHVWLLDLDRFATTTLA